MLTCGPEKSLAFEHKGCSPCRTPHIVSRVGDIEKRCGEFGFISDKTNHLLIGRSREFDRIFKRIVGLFYQKHSAIHTQQCVIVVCTEEMSLAKHPLPYVFRQTTFILKQSIYRRNLGVIFEPLRTATGRDVLLRAFKDVSVVALIPVTASDCKLIAIPRLVFVAKTFHKRRDISAETVVHVSVPRKDIFVKKPFVFPDDFL